MSATSELGTRALQDRPGRQAHNRSLVDRTQIGRAGELALALYALVTSDGELELFTPVSDDDHADISAGRRGGIRTPDRSLAAATLLAPSNRCALIPRHQRRGSALFSY